MKEFYKQVAVVMDGADTKLGNNELFAKTLVKSGITKGPQSTALLLAQVNKYEAQLAAEAPPSLRKARRRRRRRSRSVGVRNRTRSVGNWRSILVRNWASGDRDSTGDNSKYPSNEGPEKLPG